jgi:hypothetical protein
MYNAEHMLSLTPIAQRSARLGAAPFVTGP